MFAANTRKPVIHVHGDDGMRPAGWIDVWHARSQEDPMHDDLNDLISDEEVEAWIVVFELALQIDEEVAAAIDAIEGSL